MKRAFITVIFILLVVSELMSYDNKTAHREFNAAMVTKFSSSAKDWTEFKYYNFGFDLVKVTGPAVTQSGYLTVTTEDRNKTLKDWIIEGGYSADEPEVPAAYRHFYDPLSNDGKTHLTDINKAGAQFNPDVDAIFWHFMGNDVNGNNDWSWYKAKDYMIKAISEGGEKNRSLYLAKAFRALGEVLHNTADMGCPPHVRNDAHGGFGLGGSDPYEGGFQPAWVASFSVNKCDAALKSQFNSATGAVEVNRALARFTNSYFFSDETISGTGVEQFSSRNGKKDYANPRLEKLVYKPETFNYEYDFPGGRKVQMCNDQSVLLGFLTSNYRSYPRVTLKNVETQAGELVPAIIEAGINVMHHFFPVLSVTLEIKSHDKVMEGTVKHTATGEYPNSLYYNGKVSFLVDGKISKVTASASNGKFSVTETDKKFPGAKKVIAYIELAGIMVKSAEYDFSASAVIYNRFDFGCMLAAVSKATDLLTSEVTYYPVQNVASGPTVSGEIVKANNQYTGLWNITDKNPKSEGSIIVTLDGEKTATVELTWNLNYLNGDYNKIEIVTKALPFAYKADGQIIFSVDNAFNYFTKYIEKVKRYNVLWEYTPVAKDVNNLTGGISLTLYKQ